MFFNVDIYDTNLHSLSYWIIKSKNTLIHFIEKISPSCSCQSKIGNESIAEFFNSEVPICNRVIKFLDSAQHSLFNNPETETTLSWWGLGFDRACGYAIGEVGYGVMLMVGFWEVGGDYGGFAAKEIGGVMVREREVLWFCLGLIGLA